MSTLVEGGTLSGKELAASPSDGGASIDYVPLRADQVDEYIQRWIGIKTPREIAARTGLDVKEVMRRSREMLDEVDVLTVAQKRQQLIQGLNRVARDAEDSAKNTTAEFKAGLMNTAVNAYDRVLRQLAAMDALDNDKIETLNQLRVRELLDLMREVVEHSVVEVVRRYGLEDSEDEIYDVFNRHLQIAAARRDEGELE